MTMINEKETILKGLVVSTADYDTGKKIIGISSANLTPNESGIVPLSKEGAFSEEKVETLPNTEVIESLSFLPSDSEENTEVKENNPLSDINPQALNEMNVDILKGLDISGEENKEETIDEQGPTVNENMEMPVMEEVIAQEPEQINDDLFAALPNLESLEPESPKEVKEETIVDSNVETSAVQAEETPTISEQPTLTDLPLLAVEQQPKEITEEEPQPNEEKDEEISQNLNEKELLSKILEQLQRNNEMMQNILNEISEIKKQVQGNEIEKANNLNQSMIIPSMETEQSSLTM